MRTGGGGGGPDQCDEDRAVGPVQPGLRMCAGAARQPRAAARPNPRSWRPMTGRAGPASRKPGRRSAASEGDRRRRLPGDGGRHPHLQHAYIFIAVHHRRDRLRALRHRNRDVDSGVANVAMRDVPPGLSGTASGVFNASRQVGTSIGLAILGVIGADGATSAWTRQAAHLPGAARRVAIRQASNVASARIISVTRVLGTGHRPAAEQAFSQGYQVAVLIAGLGLIAAAIIAAFELRDNRRRELDAAAGKPAPPGDPDNPLSWPGHTTLSSHDLVEGTIMSIIEDIQRRSAHIHWPQNIVPEQADLFAHNDIVIAAPPGKIWEHLIHATAWPDWYSNASDVTVNASSGSSRRRHVRLDHLRRAHPQHRPRIRAHGPHRLVRRDRPVAGLPHLAARAARRGNYLRGNGRDRQRPQPEETLRSNPGHMHRGHDLWNISLKFLCESTQD